MAGHELAIPKSNLKQFCCCPKDTTGHLPRMVLGPREQGISNVWSTKPSLAPLSKSTLQELSRFYQQPAELAQLIVVGKLDHIWKSKDTCADIGLSKPYTFHSHSPPRAAACETQLLVAWVSSSISSNKSPSHARRKTLAASAIASS